VQYEREHASNELLVRGQLQDIRTEEIETNADREYDDDDEHVVGQICGPEIQRSV
jgi:hypothetical protein